MTPYEAYTNFLAIKQHFTKRDYDYFKYNGKVRANPNSFEQRKDKYFFYKLSKKKDIEGFLISNLYKKPDIWIGDLFEKDCENYYNEWKRRQESLGYIFKNEIDKLEDDLDTNLKTNGEYPKLLNFYRFNDISIDTVVIMNKILNFIPYWDKKIEDTILWPNTKNILLKYTPFVKFDEKKFRQILLDRFS